MPRYTFFLVDARHRIPYRERLRHLGTGPRKDRRQETGGAGDRRAIYDRLRGSDPFHSRLIDVDEIPQQRHPSSTGQPLGLWALGDVAKLRIAGRQRQRLADRFSFLSAKSVTSAYSNTAQRRLRAHGPGLHSVTQTRSIVRLRFPSAGRG
jgi:hypothetical protein